MWDWIRQIVEAIRALIRAIMAIFSRHGGGGPVGDYRCCHLATNTECNWTIVKSNYTCPEGFHRTFWYCMDGTQKIGCGECSQSATSCWQGPWQCSIFWLAS